MGTTTNWGWPTPDDTDLVDNLNGTLTAMMDAIDNNLPIKKASTLIALNAMTGSQYPNGSICTLINTDNILAGAMFTRAGSIWRLASGAELGNVAGFITDLGGWSNIRTMPGATFRASGDSTSRIWTNSLGANTILEDSVFNTIPYVSGTRAPGSFAGPFKYAIDPTGVQLYGGIVKTSGTFAANAVIAQLPVAARPGQTQYAVVPGAGNTLGKIEIRSNGEIRIVNRIQGASAWYDLTCVHIVK